MKTNLMARSDVAVAALIAFSATLVCAPVQAQNFPISTAQQATANAVAQKGVPLSELAPNAPDRYTVKGGDTLWGISSLFLKSPWRWPELWGMNLEQIKNPHRIYPGQILVLERINGVATLRVAGTTAGEPSVSETVRVSPKTRIESLGDASLPTLVSSAIEPFLAEPIVVSESEYLSAPRIVSAQEGRVLLSRGDRAYARGDNGSPLMDDGLREKQFRVFQTATPLKDPGTGEILGYEAIYAGKATLVRGEGSQEVTDTDGKPVSAIVPATIDITSSKGEMRVGDRLMIDPPREIQSYTPRAPRGPVAGRIVSVYGSAVANAAQNQVVAINLGKRDGMESGIVLSILKDGERIADKQDVNKPVLKLPDERNGLLMVFRTFDRISYALILEITDAVRVGDRLTPPR
jgi:hypothetical protein